MKKLKLILSTSAIVIAAVAAFALRENNPNCTGIQQYQFDGSHFKPVGQPGTDYLCIASNDTCTYVLKAGDYIPCNTGTYKPVR